MKSNLTFCSVLILVAAVISSPGCNPGTPRPNVLLISIDTLRADFLGTYGNATPTSPNLDRWAAEATVFENAHATSPWTLPSHASMLTGLYPHRSGVRLRTDRLSEQVPTIATMLKSAGYQTGAVVECHWLGRGNGLSQGFDAFTMLKPAAAGAPSRSYEIAANWMTAQAGKPFFYFLHTFDVHSPYVSVHPDALRLLAPYAGDIDGSTGQLIDVRTGKRTLSKEDLKRVTELYAADIRQMDFMLGQLLETLRRNGLAENTLVLITSDHGEEFLEHGGVLHGRTFYQEVLHVPLMVRGPNVPSRRVKEVVSLVDIVPTILATLGVAPTTELDGVDLASSWDDKASPAPRLVFAEADWELLEKSTSRDDLERMVRNERFKLIYNRLAKTHVLYDLVADPRERVDIKSEHPDVSSHLVSELGRFMSTMRERDKAPELSPKEKEELRSLGYLQ